MIVCMCIDEYSYLCEYLAQPRDLDRLVELVESMPNLAAAVDAWCGSARRRLLSRAAVRDPTALVIAPSERELPIELRLLVPLPHEFYELVQAARANPSPCLVAEDRPDRAYKYIAHCLVCGQNVCAHLEYPSECLYVLHNKERVGLSNMHAHHCNDDVGIYISYERHQCMIILYILRAHVIRVYCT